MSAVKFELAVVSYDGRVMDVPTARLLESGSLTIGRGTSNDLTLNDPERLISRSHARIDVSGNGQVTIRNVSGSSSLFVNTSEVAPGATRALHVSEQVLLGRYLLTLRERNDSSAQMARSSAASAFAAAPSRPRELVQATIPDDFDVFAAPPPPVDAFSASPNDVLLAGDGAEAIHEMFDDLPSLDGDALPGLGGVMDLSREFLGSASGELDPLAAFTNGSLLDVDVGSSSDHGLEINTLFIAPAIAQAHPPANPPAHVAPVQVGMHANSAASIAPAAAASTSVRAAEKLMDDLLGSGNGESGVADWLGDALVEQAPASTTRVSAAPANSAPRPPAKTQAPVRSEPVADPPTPATPAAARVAQAAQPSVTAARPQESTTQAEAADLKAAFARGCGIPAEAINDFTPENLEALGQIMAALLTGTIRLMHSRSSTKHEMRANVTIITTGGNNPLKFAPDSHSAMVQLLGNGLPGFMPPLRAVDGAFDDLCAHQVGLLAGSRAAMYDMAARLAPERLLEKAGEATGLDAMLASKRKARLWDLYEAGYQSMLGEAREEFEALFQRTFAQAYEQEIERISGGAPS